MQRDQERARSKRERRLFKLPGHRRHMFARSGTALAKPKAARPQNVVDLLRQIPGVTLPQPDRGDRSRGR
jgi:hypothetical protein